MSASNQIQAKYMQPSSSSYKSMVSVPLQAEEEPKQPDGPKLLLVDDQEFNIKILGNLLSMAKDYELDTHFAEAFDGQQAVDKVKSYGVNNPFHLILMDLTMPVLDGYESASQIS